MISLEEINGTLQTRLEKLAGATLANPLMYDDFCSRNPGFELTAGKMRYASHVLTEFQEKLRYLRNRGIIQDPESVGPHFRTAYEGVDSATKDLYGWQMSHPSKLQRLFHILKGEHPSGYKATLTELIKGVYSFTYFSQAHLDLRDQNPAFRELAKDLTLKRINVNKNPVKYHNITTIPLLPENFIQAINSDLEQLAEIVGLEIS